MCIDEHLPTFALKDIFEPVEFLELQPTATLTDVTLQSIKDIRDISISASDPPTSTEALVCLNYWKGGLCIPDNKSEAYGTVLMPTNLRTETILHCPPKKDCNACVRVKVDLGIEHFPEMDASDNPNYTEYDYDATYDLEDEDEQEDTDNITTYLFFEALHNQMCVEVGVKVSWLYREQVPALQKMGTVIFDCFVAAPKAEVPIRVYTSPLYHEELNKTHKVPGCRHGTFREDVKICQVPKVKVSYETDVKIHVMNSPKDRPHILRLEHNNSNKLPHSNHNLIGQSNHSIPYADIVPCLCVEVWRSDYMDAYRWRGCLFKNLTHFQENTWRKSNFTLWPEGDKLTWQFTALCNVSAQISLCWKPGPGSACQDIPDSRQKIAVYIQEVQVFRGVMPHPYLCVQVSGDEKIRHTSCPYTNSSSSLSRSSALLMVTEHSPANISLCLLEEGACIPLSKSTSLNRSVFLAEQLLQDVMSDKCEKVWSPNGNLSGAVVLCSLDQYVRQHWALAWVGLLLAICTICLILMLKRKELQGCIHFLKKDYSSSGLFQNRRILLLYSPDDDSYRKLIGSLASALCELRLAVVVDLWHHGELDRLGPMQWFHLQRKQVLEEGGMIVLLFSKGALSVCGNWLHSDQKTHQPPSWEDPHNAFATSLNCVLPDFLEGRFSGRYIVACFEDLFDCKEIPKIFQRVPVFSLPTQFTEFLLALSRGRHTLPRKKLLKGDAGRITGLLQPGIKQCQRQSDRPPSEWRRTDVSSDSSSLDYSSDILELHNLVSR
ncbi:interleukin-17 receptor C [Ambystoma mexicanum]|uniref:interleukin-17 receptor C n=1 Tax=Ambystoma mexicanum TaxID=8296 RepID=UPI0037E70420